MHELAADPFTPDKFYLYFRRGGFWITTDGGVTWSQGNCPDVGAKNTKANCSSMPDGKLAPYGHILMANYAVKNDLWLETWVGLYHSTDAGDTWKEVLGNNNLPLNATKVALGAGSGRPGDAPYTVFYLYTDCANNSPNAPIMDYGLYRSTTAGATWDRIAKRWPAGLLFDGWQGAMSASWDTFGLVGMSAGGEGFVYGKPKERK